MDIKSLPLAQQSMIMAQLARAAYSNDSSGIFSQYGFDRDYKFMDNDGAQGHLAKNRKQIIITLRGTEPAQANDLIADAAAWPKTNGVGWVHTGFRREARKLLETVKEYVAANPGSEIWIAGHSLGAAMSLYVAQELEFAGHDQITLFTFGCPRLGNETYINSIKLEHHRFVNCNDAVTLVPPYFMGYRHHGQLHHITSDGTIKDMSLLNEIVDRVKSKLRDMKNGVKLSSLNDHSMDNYISKLSAIKEI